MKFCSRRTEIVKNKVIKAVYNKINIFTMVLKVKKNKGSLMVDGRYYKGILCRDLYVCE